MSEQIIIDGVDVAGCKFITNYENVLFVCQETGRKCEITKNCYYKQLQRSQIENEQLNEDYTALKQTYEACEKEYKALNKRYEQLHKAFHKQSDFIRNLQNVIKEYDD